MLYEEAIPTISVSRRYHNTSNLNNDEMVVIDHQNNSTSVV
jgi:hypothetical protein